MGYCYSITNTEFRIDARHYPDLIDHLIKWHTKCQTTNFAFKWIDNMKALTVLNEGDIIGYFDLWSYNAKIDVTSGDIVDMIFEGEKIGDEAHLWEQISPWVNDGSYIDCCGEDTTHWRWSFREGQVLEIEATLHYDDPIECGYHQQAARHLHEELEAARQNLGWPGSGVEADIKPEEIIVMAPPEKPDTQYALNALWRPTP